MVVLRAGRVLLGALERSLADGVVSFSPIPICITCDGHAGKAAPTEAKL